MRGACLIQRGSCENGAQKPAAEVLFVEFLPFWEEITCPAGIWKKPEKTASHSDSVFWPLASSGLENAAFLSASLYSFSHKWSTARFLRMALLRRIGKMASSALFHEEEATLGFVRLAEAHRLLHQPEPSVPVSPPSDHRECEPPSEALAGARAALAAVGVESLAILGVCWLWFMGQALR